MKNSRRASERRRFWQLCS